MDQVRNFFAIKRKKGITCWTIRQAQEWTRKPNNTTVIRINQSQNQNHRYPPGRLNSRGNYEDDIDNEPLYDPVAPRIDYEVHDFDANPRDEANRRLAYRRDNVRQQDVIYDGPADDIPPYHGSKVSRAREKDILRRLPNN